MPQIGRRIPFKDARRAAFLDQLSQPRAAPILKQTNTTGIQLVAGAGTQAVTLPGGYSTRAGDCIVVAISTTGTPAYSFSGAGANWSFFSAGNPVVTLLIGWNCGAGFNSFTINNQSLAGDIVVAVFGNILTTSYPISSVQTVTSASASTLTSPLLGYTGGQLVVGIAGASTSAMSATPPTWSDGGTNNVVFNSDINRSVRMDYELPVLTASTTLTETAVGTNAMTVIVAALTPAPLITYPYDAVPIITPRSSFNPISRSVL